MQKQLNLKIIDFVT